MADREAQSNVEKVEFKKPILVGRIGRLPKRAEPHAADSSAEKVDQVSGTSNTTKTSDDTTKKKIPTQQNIANSVTFNAPFPYKEPAWSGLCPDGSDYALEVLKSGMILDRIDLTKQPFYVFGRLANSHVVMTHPTMSRHHAVLQYKAFADDEPGQPPPGWYLHDLGSTHGTFLNGVRVKPEHYCRVRVGHQIKFGASSRAYILMGPDYDCEGESDLTVTEIKEKAKQLKLERERIIKEALERKEKEKLEEEKRREEQGIDWGMGEDAEEETDLADNPYAVAANEELYLDDPKKTLRGYFEREGLELTYDCEERGVGQFICRVELPIEDARGRSAVAEVLHRGRKRDAVVQCALEACRALDRAGLLRQAKHESRRRKERDWGAEDFYDSDEDTFLDRTGSVESKRRRRMRRHGAAHDAHAPRTHDDLLKEIAELERKITIEEKALARLREGAGAGAGVAAGAGGEDALDAYMSSLSAHGLTMARKADISNAKLTIQKLRGELSSARRLAELARPHLAPAPAAKTQGAALKVTNSVVYGKRIKLKEDLDRKPKAKKEVKAEETEFVEEMDSDEEDKASDDSKKVKVESAHNLEKVVQAKEVDAEEDKMQKEDLKEDCEPVKMEVEVKERSHSFKENKVSDSKSERIEDTAETKRVFGPMRPPENYVIPENYFDQETDRDLPEIEEQEI